MEQDLNGFIEELALETNRNMSDQEKRNLSESYGQVSQMLAIAKGKSPKIGNVNITTTNLLLEYKLPAASAWCDLVMIGKGYGNKQVVIIELKNWVKNTTDAPGIKEGLITHQGVQHLHPADQVKGYTEYCQRFHSVVQDENAKVSGCVYFTKDIDLAPYEEYPNATLTDEYPLYNTTKSEALADYINERIEESDSGFAERFVKGYYKQDRNILRQVAQNFSKSINARPFVLLDEQRKGFQLVMSALEKGIDDGKKQVIIVEGPPGSGKSAVAVNLWFESVLKYTMIGNLGNIVFVTTSSSQKDNWAEIFDNYGRRYGAQNLIVPSNSFNPGMSGGSMKTEYLPIFRNIDAEKYVSPTNELSLKYEYFEDYVEYMVKNGLARNYKDNLHFLSIVDEAHALINPLAENFCTNKTAGWCFQMGPQVYHIIRESQISVFFTDNKQSFRDNETTSIADIEKYAKHLNAEITRISLAGMQFRCAGSKEYVDWVECLFNKTPLDNVNQWKDKFHMSIADYPSEMEAFLREKIAEGDNSVRILSSYSKKWLSGSILNAYHSQNTDAYDFILKDKNGTLFKKYWNNPQGYNIFVQGTEGKMAEDPLAEVGCPYVVRGFDYNYIGLLWLDDVVRRGNKWMISFNNAQETANGSTRKKAKDEQKEIFRAKRMRIGDMDLVEADNNNAPYTQAFFQTIAQAYRIVLTRAIKGICIYIKDKETREYVRSLLNS
ncbi:MAG: DUF2075 domain-containing protein [Bacteroides sp.]|nr:DUF2075 domain-containing protein [Bacteroides sp.]